jgi:hypothetical protein
MRLVSGIVAIVYFLIGLLVANSHHYLTNVNGLKGVVSLVLAIILWPLILLGVNLHLGNTGGESSAAAGWQWSRSLRRPRGDPRGDVDEQGSVRPAGHAARISSPRRTIGVLPARDRPPTPTELSPGPRPASLSVTLRRGAP